MKFNLYLMEGVHNWKLISENQHAFNGT